MVLGVPGATEVGLCALVRVCRLQDRGSLAAAAPDDGALRDCEVVVWVPLNLRNSSGTTGGEEGLRARVYVSSFVHLEVTDAKMHWSSTVYVSTRRSARFCSVHFEL